MVTKIPLRTSKEKEQARNNLKSSGILKVIEIILNQEGTPKDEGDVRTRTYEEGGIKIKERRFILPLGKRGNLYSKCMVDVGSLSTYSLNVYYQGKNVAMIFDGSIGRGAIFERGEWESKLRELVME